MIRGMKLGINGILADEMGLGMPSLSPLSLASCLLILGKTVQSIALLAYLSESQSVAGPHLVVASKSTVSNWMNELQRWCPSLRSLRFHGGSEEERGEFVDNYLRPVALSESRGWDILVTTYETLNLEKTCLSAIAWRVLIVDEAPRVKREASLFSQNLRLLKTVYRLLITGTALQNTLPELWALFHFVLPEVFTSSEEFDEWFHLDVDDAETQQRMISQLQKLLRPFMLRRLKVDVENPLPPKTETFLFAEMFATQRKLYDQLLSPHIDQIQANFGNSHSPRADILNLVTLLRKCCNHPYLLPGMEGTNRSESLFGEHLILNCGKMTLLDKLLQKLSARNHRVLIFTQMTKMLDILENYCTMRNFEFCRIDGSTSHGDREDRLADFNAPNSSKFIFLLSTRVAKGMNLQTADTVIMYDSDWEPQADLQAQNCCHRSGQLKQVHVYRLVTDDTVEVKVLESAQRKLTFPQKERLSDKELLELLKFGSEKRTRESSPTDEDIDSILEMGRKRTKEFLESEVQSQSSVVQRENNSDHTFHEQKFSDSYQNNFVEISECACCRSFQSNVEPPPPSSQQSGPLPCDGFPMIEVDEAIKMILSQIQKLTPVLISIHMCHGHIISEDIVASKPFPSFPTSMMDGYAVHGPLVAGKYQIQSRILAGDDKPEFDRGHPSFSPLNSVHLWHRDDFLYHHRLPRP